MIPANQLRFVAAEAVEYSLIQTDPLAKALWEIHLAVKKEGYVQVTAPSFNVVLAFLTLFLCQRTFH